MNQNNMKIKQEILNDIEKMLVGINEENFQKFTEIEFRFGKFLNKGFLPGVSYETFIRVQEFIKTFTKFEKVEYSTVLINKNYRKIEYFTPSKIHTFSDKDDCKLLKVQNMTKDKKQIIDIKDYGIRICHSEEIPCENKILNNEIIKRRKRFIYSWGNIQFHFTIFNTNEDENLFYDIEIETKKMSKDEYENFMNFLSNSFMKCLLNTNKIFTERTRKDILKDYYSLVNTKKFIGTKAQSLKYERLDFDQKYAISDKLDGERKLLYIRKNRIIVINNLGEIWIINDKPLPNSLKKYEGTILDTEFYKGLFYVFDIIFLKGIDIRGKETLNNRISIYNDLITQMQIKCILPKPYWFGNLYKTVSERLENQSRTDTDGIILTPINRTLNPPLKYKDTEYANTIDFKIKKISIENIDNVVYEIWNLFCYTTNNEDILFSVPEYGIDGTTKVPMELAVNYVNNSIVECYFNKITRTFLPIRQRLDKNKGNFIDIAYDNFDTDMHPFQVYWLKNEKLSFKETRFFNHYRIDNYAKRCIIKKYHNIGKLLWIDCDDGKDLYKIIDSNIRDVTGITNKELLEVCQKRYEKNIHETTKNFIFNFYD
ncbi:MAG: Melbournevirus, partial [Bacteroidota bacterium]